MDIIEMLKNLGESLADYTVGKHLEGIGYTLDDLADSVDDPAKKLAYHMAAERVLTAAVEQLVSAREKLPVEKGEAE